VDDDDLVLRHLVADDDESRTTAEPLAVRGDAYRQGRPAVAGETVAEARALQAQRRPARDGRAAGRPGCGLDDPLLGELGPDGGRDEEAG
jgi:hypothetical protein